MNPESPFAVIVNDDPIQLKILSELVRKAGLNPQSFENAEDALAAMSCDTATGVVPTLIVTDLHMPGIDGWRFCRLLRSPEYDALNNVPILVVSATYSGDEPSRIAADLGANGFLSSPVDEREFMGKVDLILSGKQTRSALRVLVVQESSAWIASMEKVFLSHGFEMDAASTIRTASERMNKTTYDVAVLAHHLPDGQGDTLLETFLARQPACVCVVTTSDPGPDLALDWMRRGAAAYLHHSSEPEHLVEVCIRARRERSLLRVQDLLKTRTLELKSSEEKYRLLVENQNDLVIHFDLDKRIQYVNPNYCETFGKTEEQLLGSSFFPLIHEEDRKKVQDSLEQVLKPPHRSRHEERALTAQGWRWFSWSARAGLSEDGEVTSIISVGRDISDQKLAEESLCCTEQNLQTLFDAIEESVFMMQRDGTVLAANKTFAERIGRTVSECLGRNVYDLIPPDVAQRRRELVSRVLESGKPLSFEDQREDRWLHHHLRPVCGPNNEVRHLVIYATDITARKHADRYLRLSALVLDQIKDHVTVTDLNGVITYINRAEMKVLGRSREGILGQTTQLYGDDPGRGGTQEEILERTLSDGEWRGEVINYAADGSELIMDCRTQVIKDDNGDPVALAGISTDITEGKRTEQALRESERRYRQIFDSSADALFIQDIATGAILDVNKTMLSLYGYENKQEALNCSIGDLSAVDEGYDQSKILEMNLTAIGSQTHTFEWRAKKKSGEKFWAQVTLQKTQIDGVDRILATVRDITEHRCAVEALRESEEKHRRLFETMSQGVVYQDAEGRIISANPAAERVLGVSFEQMQGKTSMDPRWKMIREDGSAVPGPEHPAMVALRTGERQGPVVRGVFHPERNEYLWLNITAIPLFQTGETTPYQVYATFDDITERRQAENERYELAERLRLANKATNDVIWDWDVIQDTQRWNEAGTAVFGWTEIVEGPVNAHWWVERVHPDDQERVHASFFAVVNNPEIAFWHDEYRFRKADGAYADVMDRGYVLRDEQGKAIRMIGAMQDITERKQAVEALRESEEKHRALVQGLPDIVMRFDRAGHHLFVSENVEEVTGIPAVEFLGKTHRELGFPEHLCSFWEKHILEVFDSATPGETEFSFHGQDGEIIFNWRLLPEFDSEGTVRSVLTLSLDVTAHRKAEQAYQTLFNEMFDGFSLHEIICDAQGVPVDYRFLAVNPAFEKLTGHKAKDIIGKTVLEMMPGTEQYWIENYGNVALTGEPVFLESYAADIGKYFEVSAFRPAPMQFACIFVDVTERKRAEQERENLQAQLLQSQKMESVGRLAGGVAHDFNNMLMVILGHVEFVLESTDDGNPMYADLLEVYSAARRSADLTRQLLTFARRQTITPKVLNLNETISTVLKLFKRLIGEAIELDWQPDSDLWAVRVDPSQFDQILANLCVNARDAISGVGRIAIKTRNTSIDKQYCLRNVNAVPGDYVCLSIADNGCGMDQETLQHLFEPFYTTKGVGEGTGLGLATVYGVVQQNKGFIEVETKLGQSTTFRVYLPRYLDEEEGASQLESSGTATERGHETILLVEDEALILKLVTMMLERQGYTVVAANTPGEAMRLAQEHQGDIQLLITDVIMPEMNGRVLTKKMLSLYPNLRSLFVSGYTADVIADYGVLEEGINFLQKPFSMDELAAKVREVLAQS